MGSEYDKIKKLLSEDNEPLPPELEWEHMEDGIMKKMKELDSTDSSSSIKRMLVRGGLLLILLLITTFCIPKLIKLHSGQAAANEKDPAHTERPGLQEQQLENNPVPPDQSLSAKTNENPSPSANATADEAQSGIAHNRVQPATSAPASAPLSPAENRQSGGSVGPIGSQAARGKEGRLENLSSMPSAVLAPARMDRSGNEAWTDAKSASTVFPDSPTEKPIAHSAEQLNLAPGFLMLPQKTLLEQLIPDSTFATFPLQAVANNISDQKEPVVQSGRIAISSGLSFWNMGYGTTQSERQPFEQARPSFQARVTYIQPLPKDFYVFAGLQYQLLESQFEWSGQLDDYTIVLEDTILQIQANALTGQSTEVRGDVELEVSAKRNVHHHNRTQLVQMLFGAGKNWTFKHWQAGVSVGGAVNLFSINKGRTLYQGQLVDYNDPQTEFMANQWKVHAVLGGHLTYGVTDRLGITTGVQFQQSLMNWSLEQDVRMYPRVLSLEIGLNYRLH